jgi:glycerol-1-phosphate dehydrogenase [NAD(P)+]
MNDVGTQPRGRSYTVPGIEQSAAIGRLVVGQSVLSGAGSIFRDAFGEAAALIVADETTWHAAGAGVREALAATGIEPHVHVLPARPRLAPDRKHGDEIAALIDELYGSAGTRPVPVAVGSGVINDLVRYAAFKAGTPFMSVPTAASMDGYTSGAPALV